MSGRYDCIVFWNGFPACGHMLRGLSDILKDRLKVYATRPAVPFAELGGFLENRITYLDSPSELISAFDEIRVAKCFIHTGWCYPEINRIDALLKKQCAATKVFVLVDNRLKLSLRQIMGALYFRLALRPLYDGYIVSGSMARELMLFFGASPDQIASGHYGAPSDLYHRWDGIQKKSKQFTFVGSVDKRKGADLLLEAWTLYKTKGGSWSLNVLGEGPYLDQLKQLPHVNCLGFQQPHDVSRILLNSYAFILPGRDDNWGTVLAEAAASGCILVSTKEVGASSDLISDRSNGYILNSISSISLCDTLFLIERLGDAELLSACMKSVEISNNFDSNRLTGAIAKLITL